ncbi:MAG: metal ABC transporter ATP-binding protein [Planctomycetes bacterium]|nr:metal ABC transporter ATP-binding protein [Planctomycetota bacterium]
MSADRALVCHDLTVCYRKRPAVHHLDCALPCNGLVGVVGPNGAGKSTLLHAILGWLPLSGGSITWDGHAVETRRGVISWLAQRRTQDAGFPVDARTVVDSGRYAVRGAFAGFRDDDRAAVEAAMAEMHVAQFASRPFAELSGGQQQRVLIARALASGAQVLLLDEPLTGLDAPSADDLLRRLRDWAAGGRLVVAVIHDLAVVRAWCSEVLLLNRSAIACGPTAATMSEANLARCYGPPPEIGHHHG